MSFSLKKGMLRHSRASMRWIAEIDLAVTSCTAREASYAFRNFLL